MQKKVRRIQAMPYQTIKPIERYSSSLKQGVIQGLFDVFCAPVGGAVAYVNSDPLTPRKKNTCFRCFCLLGWILSKVKMVRKLKYHEQKLLKKVDFINWEVDNNLHEIKVLRKFHIEKREDYTK